MDADVPQCPQVGGLRQGRETIKPAGNCGFFRPAGFAPREGIVSMRSRAGTHPCCGAAHSTRHATAFICTTTAGLRTFLAMSHRMFLAFVPACFADLGAQLADCACHFAATRHIARCHAANACAVHIQRDAARHRFDVLLLQAGNGAVVTCRCTSVARVDTGLVLLVCHDFSSKRDGL